MVFGGCGETIHSSGHHSLQTLAINHYFEESQ